MYRLLEKSGGPTKKADTRQEQPPMKRPSKGIDRPRVVCSRYGGKTTGHDMLGGQ